MFLPLIQCILINVACVVRKKHWHRLRLILYHWVLVLSSLWKQAALVGNHYATYFLKACFKHWTLYNHLFLLSLFYYLWTANNGAGNMTWLGKAVNVKPKDLSSIPVTHMAERKTWLIALASIYMLLQGRTPTPLHTNTKWNAFKKFFKRVGL